MDTTTEEADLFYKEATVQSKAMQTRRQTQKLSVCTFLSG